VDGGHWTWGLDFVSEGAKEGRTAPDPRGAYLVILPSPYYPTTLSTV
jgi:hypothetical protein